MQKMSVYVAGGPRGPKKIGISARPCERLRAIQTGASSGLAILHSAEVESEQARAVERHAHWLLGEQWVRGEWFKVSKAAAVAAIDESIIAVREGRGKRGRSSVGRPRINGEQTMARFRDGTLDRVKAVLRTGEKQSDFIRDAVEAELAKRERR